MGQKIYIETYGCQMNGYESDRTYRLFHDSHGYEWTPNPADADLVVYNTCSIREKADQKAFSSFGRMRIAKIDRPEMVIAVGGCMAQSRGEEILSRAPHIDLVFGTHQWAELPALIQKVKTDKRKRIEIDMYGWKEYRFLPYRESTGAHPVSEFVTIQNGCDKFCTFCLVPFTRGREMSRPPEEILGEIRGLASQGVKEVMLLGQNVNGYGRDRTGLISFADLLDRTAEISGIERIRFMTSHPAEMNDQLIERLANNPKVCEHLHLPIQSGSDRILEKMNRQYTVDQYRKIVDSLRKKIPNLFLTTDIIVGFPTETEEDFEMSLQVVKEFDFDDSYSFCYSPRKNTKAAKWTEEFVPEEIAFERLERLQILQREIHTRRGLQFLDQTEEVLVEGMAKKQTDYVCGKTRNNRTVNFPGDETMIGRVLKVHVKEVASYNMQGEIVT